MNLLGKQLCYLTKDSFDATTQPLFVVMHGGRNSSFRVAFAPDQQAYLRVLPKSIFPLEISVSRVSSDVRARQRRERQLSQAINVC